VHLNPFWKWLGAAWLTNKCIDVVPIYKSVHKMTPEEQKSLSHAIGASEVFQEKLAEYNGDFKFVADSVFRLPEMEPEEAERIFGIRWPRNK
jgi:hypothetical protein